MPSSEDIRDNVEKLERLLNVQAGLYRELLGVARRQAEEISTESLDTFVRILEEKKTIIDKIGELETEAQLLRAFWEQHREEVEEDNRARLRSVVDEIRTLLEELLEVESESQQKLGGTKDTVEEQIRQISIGPEAMRSYMKGDGTGARFMDEVG